MIFYFFIPVLYLSATLSFPWIALLEGSFQAAFQSFLVGQILFAISVFAFLASTKKTCFFRILRFSLAGFIIWLYVWVYQELGKGSVIFMLICFAIVYIPCIVNINEPISHHSKSRSCHQSSDDSPLLVFRKSEKEFDENGFDSSGYNVWGYDRDGYDHDGYDYSGYDRDGYNDEGFDRYGCDKWDNGDF